LGHYPVFQACPIYQFYIQFITKQNIMRKFILLVVFGTLGLNIFAQDIIIKNDKTEYKVKVTEIGEDAIKYKKWEMPDGPVYNLKKSEVFMIIYSNGTRETFESAKSTPAAETPSASLKSETNSKPSVPAGSTGYPAVTPADSKTTTTSEADRIAALKATKVNYSPSRVTIAPEALSSGFVGNLQSELRLVKNFVNFGVDLVYSSASTDYGVYVSGYLPLNRILGNYEKQDLGFFPFIHYGYNATNLGYGYEFAEFGADYMFKGIGVSCYVSTGNTIWTGVTFNF